MNRKTISDICFIISAVLAAVFIVKTIINYFQYDPVVNSAPFSAWILVNALSFILPALIISAAGLIIRKGSKHV